MIEDWKKLFSKDSFPEDDLDAIVEESKDGYLLMQYENKEGSLMPYTYYVLNPLGVAITKWESRIDAGSMKINEYNNSIPKQIFNRTVSLDRANKLKELRKNNSDSLKKATQNTQPRQISLFDDDDDDYDYTPSRSSYGYGGYYGNYHYEPPKPKTGYLDKLNKSDTLVIHKTDPTTTMLSQIYDGKGWDVLNDTYIDKNEMHELIKNHDRILMLGHGTSYGLMGGNIGPEEAPLLKDKKLFVIWCNADAYFDHYLPDKKDFFCTKNAPSEVWECRAAGCGNISANLMLENITYWCKLCGDVAEQAINGDVNGAVDYIRKNYLEKYGNHPVSIFNADSAHNQGYDRPLPNYEFKGEPLEPKDYPYPDFNEEEFLKNPVPYAKK